MRAALAVLVVGTVWAGAACNRGSGGETCDPTQRVTYDKQVRTILENHCTGCHATSQTSGMARMGAPRGLDLETYALAKEHAEASADTLREGTMPPNFMLDRVSGEERCLVEAWVKQGAPER